LKPQIWILFFYLKKNYMDIGRFELTTFRVQNQNLDMNVWSESLLADTRHIFYSHFQFTIKYFYFFAHFFFAHTTMYLWRRDGYLILLQSCSVWREIFHISFWIGKFPFRGKLGGKININAWRCTRWKGKQLFNVIYAINLILFAQTKYFYYNIMKSCHQTMFTLIYG
jgi:hypothetical protein